MLRKGLVYLVLEDGIRTKDQFGTHSKCSIPHLNRVALHLHVPLKYGCSLVSSL